MRSSIAAEPLPSLVPTHGGMVAESLAQTALLQTEDHREGLAAARERREPDFKGT